MTPNHPSRDGPRQRGRFPHFIWVGSSWRKDTDRIWILTRPVLIALALILFLSSLPRFLPSALADPCPGAPLADICQSGILYVEHATAGATGNPCDGSSVCIGMQGDERKMFFAKGLFWAFFENNIFTPATPIDSTYLWQFSSDGINWNPGDRVSGSGMRDSSAGFVRGHTFAVDTDGTFVYMVHGYVVSNVVTGPIEFRRGLLNANGTITWDPIRTVQASGVDSCWNQMAISVDRQGGLSARILVVGTKSVNCAAATFVLEVAYSSSSDGSGAWTIGDLENACPSGNCNTQAVLAKLGGAVLMVVYADTGAADGSRTLFSRIVNAGIVGLRTTIDSVGVFGIITFNVVGDATSNAYLAYVQGTVGGNHALIYRSFNGATWSAATTLLTPSDCLPSPGSCPTNVAASITLNQNFGTTLADFRLYVEFIANANAYVLSRRAGVWDPALIKVTTCVTTCQLYGSMAYSNVGNNHAWAFASDFTTDPHNVKSELLTGNPPLANFQPLVNSGILLFLFASWVALILYAAWWISRRRSEG